MGSLLPRAFPCQGVIMLACENCKAPKPNNIFCTCLVFDPNRQIGNVKWHGGMVELFLQLSEQIPRWQSSWGQHGAHLGPVGPRWAPCWPHEPSNQGMYSQRLVCALRGIQSSLKRRNILIPVMNKCNHLVFTSRSCMVEPIPSVHGKVAWSVLVYQSLRE